MLACSGSCVAESLPKCRKGEKQLSEGVPLAYPKEKKKKGRTKRKKNKKEGRYCLNEKHCHTDNQSALLELL